MAAIRGAICAENDVESIGSASICLIEEIIGQNHLDVSDIESIIFTVTADLDAAYPAKSVREKFQMYNVAFMCAQEQFVVNSLDKCIRVCVTCGTLRQKDVKHCYVGKASVLRPDLSD